MGVPNKYKWVSGGIVVLLFLLMISAFTTIDELGIPHSYGPNLLTQHPECPEAWDSIPLYHVDSNVTKGQGDSSAIRTGTGGGVATVGMGGFALTGPNTNIPEFNDCQRFILTDTAGKRSFGPLVAIFAAMSLDSIVNALEDPMQWTSSDPSVASINTDGRLRPVRPGTVTLKGVNRAGKPVASVTIVVGEDSPNPNPESISLTGGVETTIKVKPGEAIRINGFGGPPTTSTLAVGEVYNYGERYDPLGINPNFSCLYVYFDDNSTLRARIVPTHAGGTAWDACVNAVNPRDPSLKGGPELTVIRTTYSDNVSDYPAAARWDWDSVNVQQSIGIKCGAGWCQIGGPGKKGKPFTPSTESDVAKTTSTGEATILHIKGWYDQQFLGVPVGLSSIEPTTIKGTIYPVPNLQTFTWANFKGTGSVDPWVKVAYIEMRPGPADDAAMKYYNKKLGLEATRPGAPLTALNRVFQCYGTRSHCGVPSPLPGTNGCGQDFKYKFIPIARWWSRIVAPSGAIVYRCVTRRFETMPPGVSVPGTTRWRWVLDDETTWNDCVTGCCEEDGIA